ncbi:hypothetical protein LR48_Vigan10g098500 [Vigna angularis]|uniref:Homeobox domain-containing protein n=1 Tax=Phaseolus angularis TaxID=3914 RepID=A0A0L9VJD5_PHAAN|nr:hypothetical protein LR48_Vigan10g098500 [Vigna angularis]
MCTSTCSLVLQSTHLKPIHQAAASSFSDHHAAAGRAGPTLNWILELGFRIETDIDLIDNSEVFDSVLVSETIGINVVLNEHDYIDEISIDNSFELNVDFVDDAYVNIDFETGILQSQNMIELEQNFDLTQFSENCECDCECGSCPICIEIDYVLQTDSKFITDAIDYEFDDQTQQLLVDRRLLILLIQQLARRRRKKSLDLSEKAVLGELLLKTSSPDPEVSSVEGALVRNAGGISGGICRSSLSSSMMIRMGNRSSSLGALITTQSYSFNKNLWRPTDDQIKMMTNIYNYGVTHPSRAQVFEIASRLRTFGEASEYNVQCWFNNHGNRVRRMQAEIDPTGTIFSLLPRYMYVVNSGPSVRYLPPQDPAKMSSGTARPVVPSHSNQDFSSFFSEQVVESIKSGVHQQLLSQ